MPGHEAEGAGVEQFNLGWKSIVVLQVSDEMDAEALVQEEQVARTQDQNLHPTLTRVSSLPDGSMVWTADRAGPDWRLVAPGAPFLGWGMWISLAGFRCYKSLSGAGGLGRQRGGARPERRFPNRLSLSLRLGRAGRNRRKPAVAK